MLKRLTLFFLLLANGAVSAAAHHSSTFAEGQHEVIPKIDIELLVQRELSRLIADKKSETQLRFSQLLDVKNSEFNRSVVSNIKKSKLSADHKKTSRIYENGRKASGQESSRIPVGSLFLTDPVPSHQRTKFNYESISFRFRVRRGGAYTWSGIATNWHS